jgi:hypothetical protein
MPTTSGRSPKARTDSPDLLARARSLADRAELGGWCFARSLAGERDVTSEIERRLLEDFCDSIVPACDVEAVGAQVIPRLKSDVRKLECVLQEAEIIDEQNLTIDLVVSAHLTPKLVEPMLQAHIGINDPQGAFKPIAEKCQQSQPVVAFRDSRVVDWLELVGARRRQDHHTTNNAVRWVLRGLITVRRVSRTSWCKQKLSTSLRREVDRRIVLRRQRFPSLRDCFAPGRNRWRLGCDRPSRARDGCRCQASLLRTRDRDEPEPS